MLNKRKHHGIALLLVVVVIAATAIMAYAMLSSASLQAQASTNGSASQSATALVGSGQSLAQYYLMYPEKASSSDLTSTTTAYYNPGTHVPSLATSDGSITNITVSSTSFSSTSTGTTIGYSIDVTASTGAGITRTLRTTAQVNSKYTTKYVVSSSGTLSIGALATTNVTGDVRCDGGISSSALSGITGTVVSKPSYPRSAVQSYSKTSYGANPGKYRNNTCQADSLGGGGITSSSVLATSRSDNPGNVWFANGDVTVTGTVTLTNTTIVVDAGHNLIVNGTLTITPKAGYPALVVGGSILFKGLTPKLTANGLCWIGKNVGLSGIISVAATMTINGAVQFADSNPSVFTSALAAGSTFKCTWPSTMSSQDASTPTGLYLPDFSDIDQTPKNVKPLTWGG